MELANAQIAIRQDLDFVAETGASDVAVALAKVEADTRQDLKEAAQATAAGVETL